MNITKISPVKYSYQSFDERNSNSFKPYKSGLCSDCFVKSNSPVFKASFHKEVEILAINNFKKEQSVVKHFNNLFKILKDDAKIQKNDAFAVFAELYEEHGLKGMLKLLCAPKPSPETENILSKCDKYGNLILAEGSEGQNVVLCNRGRRGLLGMFFDYKKAPRKVELSFEIPDNDVRFKNATFSLSEKECLVLKQRNRSSYKYNKFYAKTGNLKEYLESDKYNYEITYFNEDGTINSLKTLFCGGNINFKLLSF